MRFSALIVALTIALVYITGCDSVAVTEPSMVAKENVTVTRVIDGDTIEVSPKINGTEDVRLIGVDTPETPGSPRGGQPYGNRATEFTERILEGRSVELRFDVEMKDQYDRLLAYVYLPDGSMFNEALLREGYAQVATFPPNTRHLASFEEAQQEAREAERGIWSLPESRLCQLTDRGNGIGGGC